ncbi:MAG TPA: HAD family hydrolase [Myxococcota bacterium]
MAIRAVVFDLFDTLVDLLQENLPVEQHHGAPLPASVYALHAAAARRCAVSFDAFTRAMVDGSRRFAETHFALGREVPTLLRFQDLTQRLGLDAAELPGVLTEVHMRVLRGQVSLLPHHVEVLDVVRRRARLGLCSNFSHSETALDVLEASGLRPHLEVVVISDAFGLRKPRPEIFEEVLARLCVAPEEAVHVGDNLRADVGGAAALGIRTVWLTRRVDDPEGALREYDGAPPDLVLADLAELPDALANLA